MTKSAHGSGGRVLRQATNSPTLADDVLIHTICTCVYHGVACSAFLTAHNVCEELVQPVDLAL